MDNSAHSQYNCRLLPRAPTDKDWAVQEEISLKDTVTAETYQEATTVKACWDDSRVYFRFICEDRYVRASLFGRDEPLYNEDVVEVFIDQQGHGLRYLEFEVNPNNALFDAVIDNDLKGTIKADTTWDAQGVVTSVAKSHDGLIYDISIPHENFDSIPEAGTQWRVNFYRIDEDLDGVRHYLAWSATGAVNFHLPDRFGVLTFVK
ncbi:MAG: hypothetical protein JWR03_2216 [Cohnella sp.]|nr:hypothetical protein [Cohnella sp.]